MKIKAAMYYPDFICKCGECRHVCCRGWDVNIGKNEYYRYLGIECSEELRKKLDVAFDIDRMPTDRCFARIRHNYLGDCPMLREDGLCAFQKELGEDAIPLICRVYPRSCKKFGEIYELCTSNSCEKTVELLLETEKDLYIAEADIKIPFDGMEIYSSDERKDNIRHEIIKIAANKDISLTEKIKNIGGILGIDTETEFDGKSDALAEMIKFIRAVCRKSDSMGEYAEAVLGSIGEDAEKYYEAAEKHFYAVLPNFESFFAKATANHLLYEAFPFGCGEEGDTENAFSAYITVCAMIKVFCILGMAESESRDMFIDLFAAACRFAEHSGFYKSFKRISRASGKEIFKKFGSLF